MLMNRFCTRHSHRGSSRAGRLLLARHSYDSEAQQQVIDEHGDCADCWRDTALAAVDAAHSVLLRFAPLPEIDGDGLVIGETVELLLARIDGALQAEALDAATWGHSRRARTVSWSVTRRAPGTGSDGADQQQAAGLSENRDARAMRVCHHGQMAASDPLEEVHEFPLAWNLPPGPAPLVNQFVLQPLPDGDGGPGEIVVRLGYALPSPNQKDGQPVPVTTVAAFTLSRHRAEQLRGYLTEQIDNWDAIDRSARQKGQSL
jgi:hypothetical protein